MKKDTWLIVANSSLARIFKVQKKQSLVEVEVLEHPESRLHERDITSDRPGRDFNSTNPRRHALEPQTSPKQQEFMNFARDLASYLDKARMDGQFERLYLAANPSFLGLLRQNLPAYTSQLINGEVDKDLTHMKPTEIMNYLPFLF